MSSSLTARELAGVVERFGTPTYLFDLESFSARLEGVRQIFVPSVKLCFSIKANPFLAATAAHAGLELEVCSPGELAICEALGVDPARVVYSGVCKGEDDVREALRYGVGVFTAESPSQFALIEREAVAAGVRVPVLLRLNAGSQFGMSKADLLQIVGERAAHEGTELVGIHYFVGTQRTKLKHQKKELVRLESLLEELEQSHGWHPARLEYGPGLAHPYYEGEDFSDTLAPAREIAEDLQRVAGKVALTVEMGRFFASGCGTYLTSVVDLKAGADDDTFYAFADGGINHVNYLGQMMGLKLPVVRNLSEELAPEAVRTSRTWTLCGSLCTTNDVLIRQLERPLAMGDVLAFENVGAYSITEAMYLFLSRTMPRVVLREAEGSYVLARDFVETSRLNTPAGLRG